MKACTISNAKLNATFTCGHCSRSCLSRIGLVSHERACRRCGQTTYSLFVKLSHDDDKKFKWSETVHFHMVYKELGNDVEETHQELHQKVKKLNMGI